MPIEIRELVVRTTIASGADCCESDARPSRQAEPEFDELVAECVKQVLQRLREQNER